MTVRKKKYTLSFEPEIDFQMIGISSHHSDYRLVFGINSAMGIQLERCQEAYLVSSKKGNIDHPMYEYHSPEDRIDFYLIHNKHGGSVLIPEKSAIDYFLFLVNNFVFTEEELVTALRKVDSVLAVYVFNPIEIESAQNIVFN